MHLLIASVSVSPNPGGKIHPVVNEVEGGVTPPALRYSRTSTIRCMRLSQSHQVGDLMMSRPALCVSHRGLAAPM